MRTRVREGVAAVRQGCERHARRCGRRGHARCSLSAAPSPPPCPNRTDLNAENPTRPANIPLVHVGAFAKTQYAGGNLGQPTLQAQHTTFSRAPNPDPAWKNLPIYSYHSYGACARVHCGPAGRTLTCVGWQARKARVTPADVALCRPCWRPWYTPLRTSPQKQDLPPPPCPPPPSPSP